MPVGKICLDTQTEKAIKGSLCLDVTVQLGLGSIGTQSPQELVVSQKLPLLHRNWLCRLTTLQGAIAGAHAFPFPLRLHSNLAFVSFGQAKQLEINSRLSGTALPRVVQGA